MATADIRSIPGWGVDKEPEVRPAYPKEKSPPGGTGAHWDVPAQQVSDIEVFHSTERPGITHVYGTSCPPRGLSGAMRRYAYAHYSEGRLRHWFLLIAADRVDELEGLLEDLRSGHLPNVWKEMGLNAEWRYNRWRFLARLAKLAAGAASIAVMIAGAASAGRRRVGADEPSRPQRRRVVRRRASAVVIVRAKPPPPPP